MVKSVKSEKDWEAEGDCDTLIRAEEIRNKPSRYKKAMGVMKQKQIALSDAMGKGFLGKRK